MRSRFATLTLLILLLGRATPATAEVDYARDVKPILTSRCAACHGALKQKSDLRLDAAQLLAKGGKHGAVVVPGKSAESRLIHAVTGTNGATQMPEDGTPLKAEEIEVLRKWIDEGAKAPAEEAIPAGPEAHWAFKPPARPAVPGVKNAAWVRNPIDAFVAEQHEQRGLTPRPEAERHVLLRRVYLDLTGLPPTREELKAFLADASPDAYEKVVDQLLASPRYGERWGRHWMDVWRYSDWAGFGTEVRDSQPHVWRWRDWVIESLNADAPYDRMVREMLAGDEIAPADPQTLRATGYLVRNWYKFNRNVWLENTVEHTGKAFLGVTVNCAKCHDHMYDPIAQKDFYRFRAFFEPYDVRADRVPGVADVMADGVARVYDKDEKAQTFLFVRGNDKEPKTDEPLEPGVPAALGGRLEVKPVGLPATAYYPGLLPHVRQETLAAAAAAVTAAEQELAQADAAVLQAQDAYAALVAKPARVAAAPAAGAATSDAAAGPFVADAFDAARADVWQIGPGQWAYADGKLVQSETGGTFRHVRTAAQHPQDLSASVSFTITGGQQWCSVGLSFDVTDGGDEQCVYLTAHAGGPALSVFRVRGGAPVYDGGTVPLPVKLNEPYVLRVDARDSLINVYVNGKLAHAQRLKAARQPGRFALWAYDASAAFDEARVAALPADAKLLEQVEGGTPSLAPAVPGGEVAAATNALRTAQETAAVAKLKLAAAGAEKVAAEAKLAADAARYESPPSSDAERLALLAGHAERFAVASKAEMTVQSAQKELTAAQLALNPADAKTAQAVTDAAAKLDAARKALDAARAAVNVPSPTYAPLTPVYPAASTGRRTALANWITSRDNPLAARVAVNHIWMRHFGAPLVPTVFDFGLNGKPPTHPALLDWLAVELMDAGWGMKAVHRLMVTSAAYRMRSDVPPPGAAADDANRAADPDNVYLWRANARRMEAEVVRDSVLHVASQLDLTAGGPDLDYAQGLTSARRSLYFRHAHEKQMTFLALFDAASPNECYRRDESVMPQQALALANSPLALAQSRKLAATLTQQSGPAADAATHAAFVTAAFEQVLCRAPTDEERKTCEQFLAEQAARLADPLKLTPFASGDASGVPPSADPHQRARENLVHVLLNHNDFVTIR